MKKKKKKKKGKSNFSRTKNPRRLNSQMSERPRPPIVDPSHRRHIGTRHLSLSPPRESSRGWKGNREGGIPFAECNEKKKKKKEKQGARNGTSATLDRYWREEGEGKKGKKERNQFYAPLPYRFIRGETKGVALFRAVFRWRRIDEIREWIQQQRTQRLLACAPLGRKSSRTGGTERKSGAWKFACLRWKRLLWNIRGLSFVSRRTDPGSMEWNLLLFRNWKIIFLRKLVPA